MPVFPPHPDTKARMAYQHHQPAINPYQPRMNIQELVQVPPDLAAMASEPSFQTTLLRVKEQTAINYVALNRGTNNEVESIQIDAPSRESAQLARGLIETHFRMSARLKNAESRLQKVQTDLFSVQGTVASGMMIEFSIDPELVGLALGKKGARIKQIEQETKVHAINVTGETGTALVRCRWACVVFVWLCGASDVVLLSVVNIWGDADSLTETRKGGTTELFILPVCRKMT
jgi:hypothetical protein